MNTALTQREGKRFLHKDLWLVVERQFEHATATPKGSFYDHLVAMVFALHSLEAYLNFVSEQLAPDLWGNERDFFRKEPYRGFEGKVRKVLELVSLPEPNRDTRPYSTVWLLKDLRDLIAHAKPFPIDDIVEHSADEKPSLHLTSFDTLISRENAEYARDDINTFAKSIHAAAKPKITFPLFGAMPFGGVIQHISGHTTKAP